MPRTKKFEQNTKPVKTTPKKAPKTVKPLVFAQGTVLKDLKSCEWILGRHIGQGGFGLIYAARRASDGGSQEKHVIKIEPLSNGPLFCETHFYRNIKLDQIPDWLKKKNLKCLGIPKEIVTGNYSHNSIDYRFLVMERFGEDLQSIFERQKRQFSPLTAMTIGLKVIDVLEFIHGMGYVHADIKAANILCGLPPAEGEIFVVDFGLAYRYSRDGKRTPYKEDPKRRHDGTLEFCSRDAHRGVNPAPRGDFETLSFCLLQWLGGHLPWESLMGSTEKAKSAVAKLKEELLLIHNVRKLASDCGVKDLPDFIKFLETVSKLGYEEEIDYEQLRGYLFSAVRRLGGNIKALKVIFDSPGPQKKVSANGNASRKRPQGCGDERAKSPGFASPRSPVTASPRSLVTASPRSLVTASTRSLVTASPHSPVAASPSSPKRPRRVVRNPRDASAQTSPWMLQAHKQEQKRRKKLQS